MSLIDDNIIIAPTNINNPNLSHCSVSTSEDAQSNNKTCNNINSQKAESIASSDIETIIPFYKKRWFLMSLIIVIILSITALLYLYFTTTTADNSSKKNIITLDTIGSNLKDLNSIKNYEDDVESSIDIPITRFNKLEKISESSENEEDCENKIEEKCESIKPLIIEIETKSDLEPINNIKSSSSIIEIEGEDCPVLEELIEDDAIEEIIEECIVDVSDKNKTYEEIDDESFEKFKNMFDD